MPRQEKEITENEQDKTKPRQEVEDQDNGQDNVFFDLLFMLSP
jgi:hypothetical protein